MLASDQVCKKNVRIHSLKDYKTYEEGIAKKISLSNIQ